MTAEEMWKASGLTGEYEAWSFGEVPDKLADLVVNSKKRATSSAYAVYEAEDEETPKAGEYSIILNSKDEAVCIIKTIKVGFVPFKEVSAEFAAKEGEGDLSLAYWRDVHQNFFTEELKEIGMDFSKDMLVVCEEFEVVYK